MMITLRDRLKGGDPPLWWRNLSPWREASCGGIRVHYKRHLDGGGTRFGQDFAPFLRSRGIGRQARLFEWCAGPGFIGFSLLGQGLCETLCLADISTESVDACRKTIDDGGLADRATVYHSDNLRTIPPSERWDLVVSNPPHFTDDFIGDRRSYDQDWSIHREFFTTVTPFLKPGAVIVLQENNRGSTADTFQPMIADAGLSIVFVDRCAPERTRDNRFYYIGIMRRGDTPPAWANDPIPS